MELRRNPFCSSIFQADKGDRGLIPTYYIRWYHTASSLSFPKQKALPSKPSVKERALLWLTLSSGNAGMKQPRSCPRIHLLWDWAPTVPLAAAWRFLHLAPYTASELTTLRARRSSVLSRTFLQCPLHGAAFWGSLENFIFADNITYQVPFLRLSMLQQIHDLLQWFHTTMRHSTLLPIHRRTGALGAAPPIPHSHSAITKVTLVAPLLPQPRDVQVQHSSWVAPAVRQTLPHV